MMVTRWCSLDCQQNRVSCHHSFQFCSQDLRISRHSKAIQSYLAKWWRIAGTTTQVVMTTEWHLRSPFSVLPCGWGNWGRGPITISDVSLVKNQGCRQGSWPQVQVPHLCAAPGWEQIALAWGMTGNSFLTTSLCLFPLPFVGIAVSSHLQFLH